YRELRILLEKKKHQFKTLSDTEVIVHGYEEWGDNCFDRFNGMFAVALYDTRKEKLILTRDHFGIKPLYYALIGKRLIFSSEIRPIINSGLVQKKPNDRIIYRYLKFRIHDDQKETFFGGIQRLMPGEIALIQKDKVQIKKFTELEEELKESSRHVHTEQSERARTITDNEITAFRKRIIEAVKLRLISEVPVGTCLSGGLDSSTVVSVINKLLYERVSEAKSVGKIQDTFSAVFPGGSNDEEKYVDAVIQKIKVKSHKVNPKPEEFFKELEEFVKTQEEPTISTGPYAQYKVMEEAHKHVTVVLDGQGSDEMMAGYLPYYFVYLRQLKKEKYYSKLIRELWSSRDVIGKYFLQKLLLITGIKKNINSENLLHNKFNAKFKTESFIITRDNLKKRLVEDIFRNSLQSLLRYEDKNSMRFSIEGRVPFLDFTLLQYLFSLPDEAIIKNGWNKYILREAIKDLLPVTILERRDKIGFTTPEYEWFMRMKNKIYSIFLSESFAKRKYFNQQEVLKAFQEFIEGKVEDTMIFWRLLNLEMWMRVFFDKKSASTSKALRSRKLGEPNEGKKLIIKVEKKEYRRYPIRTELFQKGDSIEEKVRRHLIPAVQTLGNEMNTKRFFIVISEKIVAITQGRSYFIWDIKPSFLATLLSKFVSKTPYGIGLGSPWTMQLAIEEVGLGKILLASIMAFLTKPIGLKGIFYKIAGREVASIDGPTEYSLYPSNVSAKLGPKNPEKIAEQMREKILSSSQIPKDYFLGTVIIDANDLGQKVLGNSTSLSNNLIEKIFSDNPMGQADEQTPVVLVFE
ncbi:asparagine synthase (glutamine-hydrolyzing), partial [Candidatus Roizmanbacteria bacterium]|nr:asparagine synthase (glutamine-hydrolyzing) [Candidatus Roizmanbacteria bacterium]